MLSLYIRVNYICSILWYETYHQFDFSMTTCAVAQGSQSTIKYSLTTKEVKYIDKPVFTVD